MFIPVDQCGHWLTISILNCDTICAFQSAGEVIETSEMFQPALRVNAKSISLEEWENTLIDAMQSGVGFAVEFLVLGSPKLVPVSEMLDEVRQRLTRQRQYAVRRPLQFAKSR